MTTMMMMMTQLSRLHLLLPLLLIGKWGRLVRVVLDLMSRMTMLRSTWECFLVSTLYSLLMSVMMSLRLRVMSRLVCLGPRMTRGSLEESVPAVDPDNEDDDPLFEADDDRSDEESTDGVVATPNRSLRDLATSPFTSRKKGNRFGKPRFVLVLDSRLTTFADNLIAQHR
jgi:hypothetical protein